MGVVDILWLKDINPFLPMICSLHSAEHHHFLSAMFGSARYMSAMSRLEANYRIACLVCFFTMDKSIGDIIYFAWAWCTGTIIVFMNVLRNVCYLHPQPTDHLREVGVWAHMFNDGELCLRRAKSGTSRMEAHSDTDVQIVRHSWV